MAIDLIQALGDDRAAKSGGFAGAVFTTYTLNLNFYEQIVAQALGRAGCANVLIIADPDGYTGALQMGAKTIAGVGRQYVCTPLLHRGKGVQHVKVALLAGTHYGRLLIGSGNLTLHGYGRNLELCSDFEFDAFQPDNITLYAFHRVWQWITQLEGRGQLTSMASTQLDAIRQKATWLDTEVVEPPDFRVWHNQDVPIWEQLQQWRASRGLGAQPPRTLRVISPYYDKDTDTLYHVAKALPTADLQVYLGTTSTNLNGQRLAVRLAEQPLALTLFDVKSQSSRPRSLHAKAIVGIEDNGAWCMAGSANLTRPGLLESWVEGGNMEMVTFQWHPDRSAFEYLIASESIRIHEIGAQEVVDVEEAPSERLAHGVPEFVLSQASLNGSLLEGKVERFPTGSSRAGTLEFLRTGPTLTVSVDASGRFAVSLPRSIDYADAIRLVVSEHTTPYRWIDQPAALARFGARTYHAQVRSKLESFDGAGKLFQDLLNFLWERVDPTQVVEEGKHDIITGPSQRPGNTSGEENTPPAPPPESFVTDEILLDVIGWYVSRQHPYDRSNLSLRDLLSLVLLRLTTPTQMPEVLTPDGKVDDEATQHQTQQQEAERISVLENLRNYVLGYCRRYGQQLIKPDFIKKVGPYLLSSNHFVLGRVLIELVEKVEPFTNEDLQTCFWWVWAPLVWPGIVGLEGQPTWLIFKEDELLSEFRDAWEENNLDTLTIALLTQAFGMPPHWQKGLDQPEQVQRFMVIRELIARICRWLGKKALVFEPEKLDQVYGIRSLDMLYGLAQDTPHDHAKEIDGVIKAMARYRPSAEERLLPLLQYYKLDRAGQGNSPKAKGLLRSIEKCGLQHELALYQHGRLPIQPATKLGADYACSVCHIQLTQQSQADLLRGELVLCSDSKHALLYHVPALPEQII